MVVLARLEPRVVRDGLPVFAWGGSPQAVKMMLARLKPRVGRDGVPVLLEAISSGSKDVNYSLKTT